MGAIDTKMMSMKSMMFLDKSKRQVPWFNPEKCRLDPARSIPITSTYSLIHIPSTRIRRTREQNVRYHVCRDWNWTSISIGFRVLWTSTKTPIVWLMLFNYSVHTKQNKSFFFQGSKSTNSTFSTPIESLQLVPPSRR